MNEDQKTARLGILKDLYVNLIAFVAAEVPGEKEHAKKIWDEIEKLLG